MIAYNNTEAYYKLNMLFIKSSRKPYSFRKFLPPNVEKTPAITGKSINLIIENIDAISQLGINWDDDGAEAITEKSILKSKEVVFKLYSSGVDIDYVFPLRSGGIQLEIDDLNKFIEIEISSEGETKFIIYNINFDILKIINHLSEGVKYLKQYYKKL
jgi:hypothetical protein